MKSWWACAAAAVLFASPAVAAEHHGGGGHSSGGSGASHQSGGGHTGGGHSGGGSSSGGHSTSGGHSDHATSRSADHHSSDSHSSAESHHPSSSDSRSHFEGSRRYTPPRSYGYRPYSSSSYYRYRPGYYYNYRYYPRYVYGGYYGGYYRGYYGSYGYYDDGYYGYDNNGAVRVLVEPSETAVYVDGYYTGVADDFDGAFQRLYLPPGRHEVALKLAGYRTWSADVYASAGHTLKLRHDMVRGEGAEDVGRFSENPADQDDAEARDSATLHLEVQPADAAVYIDGEVFSLAQKDVPIPEGRHRIEVVRPGYRSEEREFEARAGKTFDVRIDLARSDARASDARR
jgi:hypothetical protein